MLVIPWDKRHRASVLGPSPAPESAALPAAQSPLLAPWTCHPASREHRELSLSLQITSGSY